MAKSTNVIGGTDSADEDAPRSFTVDGNMLTILSLGSDRLAGLIALIDGAQRSLRLLYYIYCPDDTGRLVRDAVERALDRGVTVSLIVDGFGSTAPADFFTILSDKGATVCRFLPRFGRRYLLRNHQKLALADESVALIGGFNIEDAYFDNANGWRDLGLRIEGPAAERLTGYFDALSRWTKADRGRLRDLGRMLGHWSEPAGGQVRWLFGGPMRRLSPWALTLRADIGAAAHTDMIASYFVPNPLMLRRLEQVAKRGGQTRVVTAAKSDHPATIAAARHTYARLIRRGVRVFEYLPLRLHTKLFVIDRIVHIGSANFDVRSLYLNLELMLRVEDEAFAAFMRSYVEREIANSREITAADHAKAGWTDRLRWSLAYFVVAILDNRLTRRLNFGVEKG